MTKTEQTEHLDKLVEDLKQILLSKGDDYSGKDRLSNFKTVAGILKITPELSCLNLIATKVARLGTLLNSGTTPNNESIEDSIKDLINYSILLHMIHYEPETKFSSIT